MIIPPRYHRRIAATLFALFTILSLSVAQAGSQESTSLTLGDYDRLAERKLQIQQEDPKAKAEYQALCRNADRMLQQGPVTVMQKKRVAPSGDKHDYLSLAPYWWPDPIKPDGLPYIRRDGRVNPTTRDDYVDYPTKQRLLQRVNTLTMAAFYSDDPRYEKAAVAQVEAWFVDPKTRMNPHLEYAQGVPGRNDGRCFGIIEWCDIDKLLTPIQLLRATGALTEASDQAVVEWFESYLKWLRTSEKGREESTRLNNHGTWYDVQVASILLFLDKKVEARDLLEAVKTKRIATQIEPDGRQPHELARTKSLSYSKMNLSAFKRLARLGDKVGVDLMSYETDDGRSIRKAEAFLAPYTSGKKKWEYPQL